MLKGEEILSLCYSENRQREGRTEVVWEELVQRTQSKIRVLGGLES